MKPLKILNSLTAVALISGVFSAFLTTSAVKVSASDVAPEVAKSYEFSSEAIEAASEDFKISVQSSTSTSTSQAYTLKFMSSVKTHSTGTSPYNGVHISTDDSTCPVDKGITELTSYDFDVEKYLAGDKAMAKNAKDWIEADEEGNLLKNEDGTFVFKKDENGLQLHDYKSKIPVYDGYVYELDPSDISEYVIIPNYINRSNRYLLHVTTISSNVFNFKTVKDSEGVLKEKSNLKKVRNIFIGANITNINENAFEAITETYTGKDAVSINICGPESGIDAGSNWAGKGVVNYNYNIDDAVTSGIVAQKDATNIKQMYDDSAVKDKNGETAWFDENGYPVTADGHYLDEEGNVTDEVYSGAPVTHSNARIINFNQVASFVSESSFVFGDYESNRPMLLEYQYTTKSGENKTGYYEFPLSERAEGMGSAAGVPNVIKNVDIHINEGDVIDSESLVVRNIFKSVSGQLKADLENEYFCAPSKGYKREFSLDQFVTVSNEKVRKYGEYTSFSVTMDKVDGIYADVNPSSWNQYKNKVASGELKVRYSLTSFNSSTYSITYVKNGAEVTKDFSFNDSSDNGITLNFHLLTKDKGNDVTFLLKNKLVDEDFNIDTVRKVEYKDLSFKLDLMNTKKGTTQTVTKSEVVTRFGYVDIYSSNAAKAFNADMFLVIMEIAFVVAYLAGSVGYYFFAKNKYKNDEFRRMNTKKYIKEAVTGFVGGGIVYSALLFIILRFGLFNVSVIVYNPLDPLVMILGVVSIVIIGLFIKKMITVTKIANERRKTLKLKLNEDVADDGTK